MNYNLHVTVSRRLVVPLRTRFDFRPRPGLQSIWLDILRWLEADLEANPGRHRNTSAGRRRKLPTKGGVCRHLPQPLIARNDARFFDRSV
jgi:hypothetical protein